MVKIAQSTLLAGIIALSGLVSPLNAAGDALSVAPQTEGKLVLKKHPHYSPTFFGKKKPGYPAVDTMVGQMLMLGFKGTEPGDLGARTARKMLAAGKIGGVIFMGANMRSKQQITDLISYIRGAVAPPYPPLLGIDQEGGKVQRLSSEHGFTQIPTAEWIGTQPIEKAYGTYARLALELSEIAININFGPVVDLNLVPSNPIIGKKGRSYGRDAALVKKYAMAFVLAHRAQGILTSLKHFPGHGSSWTDSHIDFVDLSKSWKPAELAPYRELLKEDLADTVMVGHLFHPEFSDTNRRPASLSRKAVTNVLRKKIGFNGLIITDDLGMGAVKKHYTLERSIIHAVNAGNDILLLADGGHNTPEGIERLHSIVRSAVKSGEIKIETLHAAFKRIVRAKQRLRQFRQVRR